MLRIFTASAIIALSIAAGTASHAESADAIPVTFGDLNLSSRADTKILADRLQAAALQVCTADNVGKLQVQECMDSAIAIAMSDIETKLENRLDNAVHA